MYNDELKAGSFAIIRQTMGTKCHLSGPVMNWAFIILMRGRERGCIEKDKSHKVNLDSIWDFFLDIGCCKPHTIPLL